MYRRRQRQPTPVLLPGQSHGWRSLVGCSPWGHEGSDMTERLHFHFSLSHSSVLAWRIPGTVVPGGLPSMGSHRVGHDSTDLAAAVAAAVCVCQSPSPNLSSPHHSLSPLITVSLFSTTVTLFVFVNNFTYIILCRFHISVISCDICLCLTYITQYDNL